MKKIYTISQRLYTVILFLTLCCGSSLIAQNGEYQWSAGYGGTSSENSSSITTDAAGNSYTTGDFSGTVDFDPGAGVFNLGTTNGFKPYISVLDAAGDLTWAGYFECSNFGKSTGISLDGSGNIYTTGWFTGTTDFDPGTGTVNISSAWNSYDFYVSKLDAAGNYLWAKKIGKTSFGTVFKNYADAAGNIYVTGLFNDPIDFDPGTGNTTLTPTSSDEIFVLKLDAAGDFVWVKQFSASNGCIYPSIHVDAFDDVYLSGSFKGTMDADPGTGIDNLTAVGSNFDMFISKLDNSGNFLWAKSFGASGWDYMNDLTSDAAGNVYTTGGFNGTVDFDPGTGTNNLVTGGSYNAFVQKLDASGNFEWASRLGGSSQVVARAIQVDVLGNVYSFGDFSGLTDFDPGTAVFNLSTNGGTDGFISKLDASGNFVWVKNIGGSGLDRIVDGAVDLNGNSFATGDYNGTGDFDPGTGVSNITSNGNQDIYVVKLGCGSPSTGIDSVTVCDSYVFNGVTYSTSNYTAKDTLTSSGGCDSIVTLNLTILNATNSVDTYIACDSFTWINGVTYTSSNFSTTFTTTNAAGCDSILQLDLTITNIDASTTLSNNTITSNETGVDYQWVDCDNGNAIITAETNQSFTTNTTGNFAVIVNDGICIDTSDCVSIIIDTTNVGINDLEFKSNNFQLYPNPTSEFVTFSDYNSNIDLISILDLSGKTIKTFNPKLKVLDVGDLQKGVYIVNVQLDGQLMNQKLIIE